MTLITGIYCNDGLLVMGDREESGHGGKRSVQKLFRIIETTGKWVMVVGTAGHAALGELAMRRIALKATKFPLVFVEKHETFISAILDEIYDRHIRKQNLNAYERQNREIALIIAIKDLTTKPAPSFYLYRTEEEVLNFKVDFACAGAGEDIATYFLDRLHNPMLTRDQLLELALFIVREAKDSVSGVGKETESHFLPFSGSIAESHWRTLMNDLKMPRLADCMNHFWLTPSVVQKSELAL
jgi:20S proteasome alpha/beta subunit